MGDLEVFYDDTTFSVGDEVMVHPPGELHLIGNFNVPVDTDIGIIRSVQKDDRGYIFYDIEIINKLSFYRECNDTVYKEEGRIQKTCFALLKYETLKSILVSQSFRKLRNSTEKTVSLTEKEIMDMQMRFFEMGLKKQFPEEWKKYAENRIANFTINF